MSSENFQTTYTKIAEVGHSILKYLQSFRNEKLSEGDDTKSLQSVEKDINTALTALKEQHYEVAVVAPMKAGKSTFLNAIIGAEVLASETAACTVCRTDISHINENQTPELLEYREGRRKPISLAKGSVNEIQQKFLERTREFRSDKNSDKEFPTSFELRYPIEAINGLSSLAGLRLIDTPGPNEWKSMSVDVVKLKQSTLEALRNCNAVLFVLNYRSFKDNAVDELFQTITENRKELLGESKARIYFILNQIDLRSEKDPEISETISSLKADLEKFGFPEPSVYPVSALQGLYAKCIQKGIATEQQKKDFKKFFSARYARENEDGDLVIPKPEKIAPRAIEDSGIIAIQEAIFQRIIKEAGWNLLDDVLEKLKKAATAIEDTLNTHISGWEMEISTLKQKVEEYKKRAKSAQEQVKLVNNEVEAQKKFLIKGFYKGVDSFANEAKLTIQEEIDQIAKSRSKQVTQSQRKVSQHPVIEVSDSNAIEIFGDAVTGFLDFIPVFGNFAKAIVKLGQAAFKVRSSLKDKLKVSVPEAFNDNSSSFYDPYVFKFSYKSDAEKLSKQINDFCSPHIQSWWLDTQDILVREGTKIRQQLTQRIQERIQVISDELSSYLGDALEVELNVNPIQFPDFEFKGIDAQVQHQQEVYTRYTKEKKTRSRCCNSDEVYEITVPIEETRSFYEVDLRQASKQILQAIDAQVLINKQMLERVIEKQIQDDFRSAENQINDFINKFQSDFDQILREKEQKEAQAPEIIDSLKAEKERFSKYLKELQDVRDFLNSWKQS
jgi:GTPase Era involved in 16S rRNA processing